MSQVSMPPANDPHAAQASGSGEYQEDELEVGSRFVLFNVMPSWLVSFLTHIALIIVLALMYLPDLTDPVIRIESGQGSPEQLDDISMDMSDLQLETSEDILEQPEMFQQSAAPEISQELDLSLPDPTVDLGNVMGSLEDTFTAAESIGELSLSNETSARTGAGKQRALLENGGTQGSEDAVQLALQWIVKHQLEDGGWNIDHTIGPGNFRNSPDPGLITEARNGATALALLPLLGAGNTHITGKYKEEVRRGLEFLKKRAKRSRGKGIAFWENQGTMYSHGLVAIVFNEAYAMTNDPELAKYAQGSLWFIEEAQDPIGGGWRYEPRDRGDTSAVGWQLMALKSGKIMGLNINPRTYKRASKFLDSVSTSNGSFYGYMNPPRGEPANARTAVGLLCRMYMGWDRDVPGLVDGVEALAAEGPSVGAEADMYYNYYATQVIKHYYDGQSEWKAWNVKMRDFLIKSQAKQGDSAGSWHFGNKDHASRVGGRLYNTSMAAMTLEVYYRFLPLYGDKAASEQFELID